MKTCRAALVLLLAALALPLSSFAMPGDDVGKQLKSEYEGKVLTLRHFYQGERLSFQSDGPLIGLADVGPWTVDAQIEVKQIKLGGRELRIRGRRVCLVFDSKAKTYRDVLQTLAESKLPDRDKREDPFRKRHVEIAIALGSDQPSLSEVSSAMNAVFLTPEESLRDFVPDFWRDYFDQMAGRARTVRHSTEPVYSIKPGVVSPPRPTYDPNPAFSEEARQAKYQGTMTLSLIVDPSGDTKDIQIVSPLGLGLDESAIASVSTWKFTPAMKDGKPVTVQIQVEVDFHLY